jgi:hypothetical protein
MFRSGTSIDQAPCVLFVDLLGVFFLSVAELLGGLNSSVCEMEALLCMEGSGRLGGWRSLGALAAWWTAMAAAQRR